ncbi:MAG: TonB-dependent receptor [Pseudomonadota bacterium]
MHRFRSPDTLSVRSRPFCQTALVSLTALMVTASPVVLAQETATGQEPALEPIENVIVTGSRLEQTLIEGAYPVTTIERDVLERSGVASIGELLQELPFVGGSPISTGVGARGAGGGFSRGTESIELRGLGEQRTLILLNGRRFVPGGSGASGVVDLGMIPLAWIERVEILKTGASVEYGADAVAGVINLITRSRFEGVSVQVTGGSTDRGDGENVSLQVTAGRSLGRAQVVGGLQFTDQQSVSKGDRAFSSQLLTVQGPDNEIVPDGSSAPPQGNFRTSDGRLTLIDGEDGAQASDFRPFVSSGPENDRFNFNPFEDLVQDSRRFSAFIEATLPIGERTELFAEALYHQRDSDQQLAPLPLFTSRETDVVVDANNLFNPFGETLSDARRRLVEAGPREFIQDNTAWRGVLGARGDLGGWGWDVSLNHARNETHQRQTGDLLDDRLRAALGPSFIDASGRATCGTPAAPIADCVPLNLFGGPGSIDADMLAFIGADLQDFGVNEQTVVSLNAAGSPLRLWAGDLSMAVGYEYRREEGRDEPDAQTIAGNTSGAARAITEGSFESNEVYFELGVPLLVNQPFAQALELELGTRLVDYSSFDSRSVFDVGLHWQPVTPVVVRAAWSQAFRAPNVGELFGGVTQSNPAIDDPCADFSQLSPSAVERCIAQGVPADGSFDQTGNETPQLGGGNPLLAPEEAEIITAGITWRAATPYALEIALDYYDIEIDGAIGALGGNTVLSQCLATGQAVFCDRIQRDGAGNITQIETALQNIAQETARGMDLSILAEHDAPGGLTLTHNVTLSRVLRRDLIAFPGADPFVGVGEFDPDRFGAIPRWRGNYRLGFSRGRWGASYEALWIGALQERGGEVTANTARDISARVYHDFTISRDFDIGTRVTLGVDNLTDRDPPFFANADEANTDVTTYPLLGRTFWLRLGHRFGGR